MRPSSLLYPWTSARTPDPVERGVPLDGQTGWSKQVQGSVESQVLTGAGLAPRSGLGSMAKGTWARRPRGLAVFSPQPQHSHLVVQQLLSHLDANSRSAATVRAGIVEVLSEAAVIAATGSVGKGASLRWWAPLASRMPGRRKGCGRRKPAGTGGGSDWVSSHGPTACQDPRCWRCSTRC